MANEVTQIDKWEVRDLEDDQTYKIEVESCTELGSKGMPGLRIKYYIGGTRYYCIYEPLTCEKHAYDAKKAGGGPYPIPNKSWTRYEDRWVKNELITEGGTLKARVSIKVRSKDEPVVKEYDLPFEL